MMTRQGLTLEGLVVAAHAFAVEMSSAPVPELYATTDGKAVGTFVEQAFHRYLIERYSHRPGSAASGIDLPELNVDLKVTSVRQPQSSSPFRAASQKVYGLGYHLLVFVYDKVDDHELRAARIRFVHSIFISQERTGDYQTTRGILDLLSRSGNAEDVEAFLSERNLPLDDIGRAELARRIMADPPRLGVLTISNALQWRLQYGRAIGLAGAESGVVNLAPSA